MLPRAFPDISCAAGRPVSRTQSQVLCNPGGAVEGDPAGCARLTRPGEASHASANRTAERVWLMPAAASRWLPVPGWLDGGQSEVISASWRSSNPAELLPAAATQLLEQRVFRHGISTDALLAIDRRRTLQ